MQLQSKLEALPPSHGKAEWDGMGILGTANLSEEVQTCKITTKTGLLCTSLMFPESACSTVAVLGSFELEDAPTPGPHQQTDFKHKHQQQSLPLRRHQNIPAYGVSAL